MLTIYLLLFILVIVGIYFWKELDRHEKIILSLLINHPEIYDTIGHDDYY